MNQTEVYERLTEVFRDVFDEEDIVLTPETTAQDIEGWDSLSHISLIAAIEDEFGIRFDMKQVLALKNVGELVNTIRESAEG